MGGIGAGANSTASMAIMSSFSKAEREKFLGWIQAANGLGLLAGPIAGALFFQFGGYQFPFIMFASLYLVLYPFVIYFLKNSSENITFIEIQMSPMSKVTEKSLNRIKV